MVIYDVQEKLQLFKKPLGDFNDGPKGNRLPDPLFNAALLNVCSSKSYIPSIINTHMNLVLSLFLSQFGCRGSAVNSRFKKVYFSFLKLRVV